MNLKTHSMNQDYVDILSNIKGMSKEDKIKCIDFLFDSYNSNLNVSFGKYFQFAQNEKGHYIKEPILWKILNNTTYKDDGYLLLLSKYLIETYHFSYHNNKYKTSDIRKFLNEEFFHLAFTKVEKNKIAPITIEDEKDSVFLLSKEDYENPNYFTDDNSRKASCTDYAISLRGYQSKTTQSGTYWTRSSGSSKSSKGVVIINHKGRITSWRPYHTCPGWHHSFSSMAYETVRPAIIIGL